MYENNFSFYIKKQIVKVSTQGREILIIIKRRH